jgi:hypothetical protein
MPPRVAPNPAVVAELLQLEAQFFHAYVASDVATLDRLLADEATFVHLSGHSQGKPALLAGKADLLASGGSWPDLVKVSQDVGVRLYGETAVISGRQVFQFGVAAPVAAFVSQVWVQREGRWQQVLWQGTRVQQ